MHAIWLVFLLCGDEITFHDEVYDVLSLQGPDKNIVKLICGWVERLRGSKAKK